MVPGLTERERLGIQASLHDWLAAAWNVAPIPADTSHRRRPGRPVFAALARWLRLPSIGTARPLAASGVLSGH
jgi:hypothetical protein